MKTNRVFEVMCLEKQKTMDSVQNYGHTYLNAVVLETLRFSAEACCSEIHGVALKSETTDMSYRDIHCINCKNFSIKTKAEFHEYEIFLIKTTLKDTLYLKEETEHKYNGKILKCFFLNYKL
jgi:hypothetical protein